MEEIYCDKCNSKYRLTYIRIPARDKDRINCEVCGSLLYSWNEAKTWTAELISSQQEESTFVDIPADIALEHAKALRKGKGKK